MDDELRIAISNAIESGEYDSGSVTTFRFNLRSATEAVLAIVRPMKADLDAANDAREAARAAGYFAGWSDHKAGRAYGETLHRARIGDD